MDIKYFSCKTGRMCNSLYITLRSFIWTKETDIQHVYINVSPQFNYSLLNIDKYIISLPDYKLKKINNKIDYYGTSYWQKLNHDYFEPDIFYFIDETISKSEYLKSEMEKIKNLTESICSIHIRATDYIHCGYEKFYHIDRYDYIKKSIEYIPETIKTIDVYSDDIEYCKNNFDDLFKSRFTTVNYMDKSDQEKDLLKLSCYKYKILFNSTYSYWSGFISDYLYKKSGLIILPKKYCPNFNPPILDKWISI